MLNMIVLSGLAVDAEAGSVTVKFLHTHLFEFIYSAYPNAHLASFG